MTERHDDEIASYRDRVDQIPERTPMSDDELERLNTMAHAYDGVDLSYATIGERGLMRDLEAALNEIQRLRSVVVELIPRRDSWRRVAERIERERIARDAVIAERDAEIARLFGWIDAVNVMLLEDHSSGSFASQWLERALAGEGVEAMSIDAGEYMRQAAQARAARNKAIEDNSRAAIITRCHQLGLPEPVAEYQFSPPRRWRFDLAWPEQMLALEFEGGIHTGGRHTTGAGYERDLEKYNRAVLMGFRVLRVTHQQVADDTAIQLVAAVLSEVPA